MYERNNKISRSRHGSPPTKNKERYNMNPIYMILRTGLPSKDVFTVVVTNHPKIKQGSILSIKDISIAFNQDPFNISIVG